MGSFSFAFKRCTLNEALQSIFLIDGAHTVLPKPLMIGAEIYRNSSYGAWHPLRIPRVTTVMDLSRAMGWLPREQFVMSPRAKPKALEVFHTPDYIEALMSAERDQWVSDETRARHNIGTHSNPIFPEMFRRPATSAGASLLAGELLRNGGVVFSPAGGTHHAFADSANGFCYFNDPVLAILSLQRNGAKRVAYVDIDAHHGDGVEVAFANDPNVLMISIHEENRWPRTGALEDQCLGQAFNLPVPRGLNDDEMAYIREELVLPVIADFAPDAIVMQCGSDAITEDPQSRLCLSNNAHFAYAQSLAAQTDRMLVLGGGGYNPWSVGRCWSGVWATLNGVEIPDELPSAATEVLSALRWEGQSRVKEPPNSWLTTIRDEPRGGPVSDEVRSRVAHLKQRGRFF